MDDKQRQLEQEKTERQLEESKARLQMIDARAKAHGAEGAIAEASGLHSLHDRIKGQFRAWKDADQASFHALGDQVKRGTEALSRGTDAAADRLDRLDDADDRWLDTEMDHIGAAVELFKARLGEEWVGDKQAGERAKQDLRAAWDDAKEKQKALKAAATDKKDEARRELKASLGRVKDKLKELAARVKGHGEKTTEQRT